MRKTLAAVLRALAARLDPPATVAVEQANASTQFAGSGLVIRQYGCDCDTEAIKRALARPATEGVA